MSTQLNMQGFLTRAFFGLFILGATSACSTMSNMPEKDNVKVSREAPDSDCKSLGKVTGTSISAKGTREMALEDMTQEAANKGADYLKVEQYSAQGTSVTGIAFRCN